MSNSFNVGDLVILQHPTYYHEQDGCPAVITGGYARRKAIDMRTMQQYMAWTWEVRRLKQPDCLGPETTVLVRTYQMRKPAAGDDGEIRKASRDREVTSC